MPTYLGEAVTDEYPKGLLAAYRDAYSAAGVDAMDTSDQPLIDKLSAKTVTTEPHADLLGRYDAQGEELAALREGDVGADE